ncbi:MAG: AAA family ATPase, partial [Bacteroidetes bacterium]|nr:AAA family ATPase [Bacteroidota bacterium]
CIVCHTTLGKTAFDTPYRSEPFETQAIDTTVAEFGIACESCHGPAQVHVEANRNPLRRYGLHVTDDADPTIVLPTRLDPERSSQVCGQCHSVWEFYDLEGEREKLLRMDEELSKRVVGQPEAIAAVASAVRRGRAGLQEENRPIGSFIFLGSTGVGKTELAKALAEFLFNDENAMVRIDMSEYQERHTVSRLIGAPPGYVGFEEGGQLTEQVRRRPYSVVLLDEIEKAHPEVFNILLQVLDDGRLTDNMGRVANFKNTIIIMTSNLGSEIIRDRIDAEGGEVSEESEARLRDELLGLLKQRMRPEFLNRIDEIVLFHPLGRDDIREIADIQFERIRRLAKRSNDIDLELTDRAKDFLAEKGFDPVFGARPLKRVIQREITNKLAEEVLSGWIKPGHHVKIDVTKKRDGLVFESTPAKVETAE